MSLPKPAHLGFPAKFIQWLPDQVSALWDLLGSSERFPCLTAPTGAGKTGIYMGYSSLRRIEESPAPFRTLVLTATRALQDQLDSDFGSSIVDVRGQSNYPCEISPCTVAEAPCHGDWKCHLKTKGCGYFDRVRRAAKAQTVVTNYAFWFHAAKARSIGDFDLLICDEAHDAVNVLGDFLRLHLTDWEVKQLMGLGEFPDKRVDQLRWLSAAKDRVKRLILTAGQQARVSQTHFSPSGAHTQLFRLRDLGDRLTKLESINPADWIMQRLSVGFCGVRWDVIRPGDYAESLLFRKAKRVILVSATLSDPILDMLKIPTKARLRREYPSRVPPKHRPIHFIQTCRVDRHMTSDDIQHWLQRIDNIIKSRKDRKGIIHTVSYARAELILNRSKHRSVMISHADASGLRAAVDRFKSADAPAVLVSPSATTGLDFPGDQCEYQIIAKVPYPDGRDLVTKARTEEWADWPRFVALQTIVQAAGRAVRGPDDSAECLVIDDHWTYLRRNRRYAPQWFWQAVTTSDSLPEPIRRRT